MNTESRLNSKAWTALGNPFLFSRIEDCILSAKTELAKRRLIRAAVALGGMLYL